MEQSRKHLNEILDFLTSFHELDSDSDSNSEHSLDLPNSLSNLFRKHANWTGGGSFHVLHWGESLSVSDGAMYGMECPEGWIVFSQEREGVWVAACPAKTSDDTEVAICTRSGVTKMPSLNLFLTWLLLQESAWVAEHGSSVEHGIDDEDYWSSRGFSSLIDCEFDGGEGFVQLNRNFRLSNNKKVIAHGDEESSQFASRLPIS